MREQRPAPSAMAVPLGRHHPPPHFLLAHGAANDWLPAPDVIPAPGLDTMRKLVAEHLHKLNGRASPGLDMILYEQACIPKDWKLAKLTPLYKKGHLLDPNSYRMLALSGTLY